MRRAACGGHAGYARPTTTETVPNADRVAVSGPAVLEGRALARFTIAVADRVTVIEARIVFAAGVCSFNAVATEMTT